MCNNLAMYANESRNGNNKQFMKYWEDLSFMNNLHRKTVTDDLFFFLKLKLKWLQIYHAKLLWIMYACHVYFSNLIILFHFRPPGSSYIHYAESSMKNGFGLKYLHRFFNIPFLQLQVRANSQSQRWTLAQCLSSLASFQVESSHTLHEDFISSRQFLDHGRGFLCFSWRSAALLSHTLL